MTIGVYGLYCKATKKWYVGASTQIEARLREHRQYLKGAVKCRFPIQQANHHRMGPDATIHGLASIKAYILEEVDGSQNLSEREVYWVHRLDSVKGGYNRHIPFPDRRW